MDKSLFNLSDTSFPLFVIEHLKTSFGSIFPPHFHEHQLQMFYFTKGKATIYCRGRAYELDPPDILLINRGELHYGENMSPELRYYVFRIDLELLSGYGVIPCVQKYLDPLEKSLILLNENRRYFI